jgi:hypothetical protein
LEALTCRPGNNIVIEALIRKDDVHLIVCLGFGLGSSLGKQVIARRKTSTRRRPTTI